MHTLNPFKICATVYQVSLLSDDSLAARVDCYNPLPSNGSLEIKGGEV